MKKIMVLEDDPGIASIVAFNLKAQGYEAVTEADGEAGLSRLLREGADLLILDLMLPSLSGFEVLRRLREVSDIPVIIVSARDSEQDKLEGLSLMADDYVTKPFSVRELIARVNVNLARSEKRAAPAAVLTAGDVTVTPSRRSVCKAGKEIVVSKKEYEILLLLLQNRPRVLSREEILQQVWGYQDYLGDLHTVDVAIGRLRAKIETTPSSPQIILSRRGAGYYAV